MEYQNKEWFIQQIESGKKIVDIAKELDISNATAYRWAKKHGAKVLLSQESAKFAIEVRRKMPPKNIILNDLELLKKEYETLSLTEIASKYHAERAALVKRLKTAGIPIKRWHSKTTEARVANFLNKFPKLKDKDWLENAYKTKSIDKLSYEIGCSITAVRNALKTHNIKIRPPKRFSTPKTTPLSSGRAVTYHTLKPNKSIGFRSILECGFAMLLDSDASVISWQYESMPITYFDGFNGKQKVYICDFSIERKIDKESVLEFVEVKPKDQQLPLDKYLYAKNCVKGWRWSTDQEIVDSYKKFKSGYRSEHVQFYNTPHKNASSFNIYTTNKNYKPPTGWKIKSKSKYGFYKIFKIEPINPPKQKSKKNPSPTNTKKFDVNEILDLIKQDKSLKEIAAIKKAKDTTITNFLERNSYAVRWRTDRRHSEIRYATKKIWPPEDIQLKEYKPKIQYEWDTYEWLYEQYINKQKSTHKIGKLVGKSSRLIGKKLKQHNIALRNTSVATQIASKDD